MRLCLKAPERGSASFLFVPVDCKKDAIPSSKE